MNGRRALGVLCVVMILFVGKICIAQEHVVTLEAQKKKSPFKFRVSGSMRVDSFFDSRQNWDYWEGLDLNSIKDRALDPVKRDINDKGQFNIVQWPLMQVNIIGPDVWKAKSSAVFRADMVGRTFDVEKGRLVNTYSLARIKHAFLQLDWENTNLMIGRYYHPLSMPDCVPDTVSLNSGELFDPFQYSRMIQVRHRFKPFEIVAAVGRIPHFIAARNAISPHFYLRLSANVSEHMFCIGADYRAVVPRLETDKTKAVPVLTTEYGYKENEVIKSFIPFVAMRLKKGNSSARFRLTYAENGARLAMIGGYAVCKWDKETDLRRYTNLGTVTFWSEFSHVTEKREIGIFFGYAKNLGSRNQIARDTDNNLIIPFGWLTNADQMFRIQPRIRFFRGPIILGIELEYNGANYGTTNDYGKVCEDIYNVSNTRLLVSIIYSF